STTKTAMKNASQPTSTRTDERGAGTHRSYEARADGPANYAAMSELPETISSSRVFEGRVFDVRIDQLRYDDGSQHRIDVVEHGPSFTIAAAPAPNEVVLVRQYRHPARAELWELPAGRSEADEDPASGALRELREETGFRAGRIRRIFSLYS